MKQEIEFDFVEFIRLISKKKIHYLLIGRWAVILHGGPLMTADYDFWIEPGSKEKLLKALQTGGYEVPERRNWKRPILSVFAGVEKIDLFFFRKVTNVEGQSLSFEKCFQRAAVKEDRKRNISITIPNIEDLILLKKMPRNSAEQEMKDRTDIRLLQELKKGAG